jgi:hypothetical protein
MLKILAKLLLMISLGYLSFGVGPCSDPISIMPEPEYGVPVSMDHIK